MAEFFDLYEVLLAAGCFSLGRLNSKTGTIVQYFSGGENISR